MPQYTSLNTELLLARELVLSWLRPRLHGYDLTEQQWRIIRILAEEEGMDFQDLARLACILRPSLTGILSRLEKNGMVSRFKPLGDQRRVLLKLTQQGQRLVDEVRPVMDAAYAEIEALYGTEKLTSLRGLLSELSDLRMQGSSRY